MSPIIPTSTRSNAIDVAVIGAGPAGLAAAANLGRYGLKCQVFEAGPEVFERGHDDHTTVVEGVGGAGLFSDGKFSFWPSASQLWGLDPTLLEHSWAQTDALLQLHGIESRPYELDPLADRVHAAEDAVDKRYPSVYADPDTRRVLIDTLRDGLSVATGSRVTRLRQTAGAWQVDLRGASVISRFVVVATGRFGPLYLHDIDELVMTMRRLEVGVRIDQPSHRFFLRRHPQVDPKMVWHDGPTEWRTFCCCRDGLLVNSQTASLLTVSGRADCAPTGRSNAGFNVRLTEPDAIRHLWPGLRSRLEALEAPVRCDVDALLNSPDDTDIGRLLGPDLAARLRDGLHLLLRDFGPSALDEAVLVGPTLEGVGMYPWHDSRLATSAPGLWVAGDVTGSFRGLVAALVSGHLAANSIQECA